MKIVKIFGDFIFTDTNNRFERRDIKGVPDIGDKLTEELVVVKEDGRNICAS